MRCLVLAILILGYPTFAFGAEPDLIAGYINKSKKPLASFLKSWHAESKPVAKEVLEKKPGFEQELYRLYSAFFQPADFYRDVPYLFVQHEVDVTICDSDLKTLIKGESRFPQSELQNLPVISHVTVKEFRPDVKAEKHQVLYYDEKFIDELLFFLTPNKAGETFEFDSVWQIPSGSNKVRKRIEYLKSHLLVIPGHWGKGFHFASHPEASHVYFNRDLTRAIIPYREHYGGGEAYLEQQMGKWIVLDRVDSWVE